MLRPQLNQRGCGYPDSAASTPGHVSEARFEARREWNHGDVSAIRHEALLHEGDAGFVTGTVTFIRDGLERGEAILVCVTPRRFGLLREALQDDADAVRYCDMEQLGANPGRIIPAWRAFVDATPGPVRGVGEPCWPGRDPQQLAECGRHESLLNVAFAHGPPWRLLCPYDVSTHDDRVLEMVRRTHPLVHGPGSAAGASSELYDPLGDNLAGRLPPPAGSPAERTVTLGTVAGARGFAAGFACHAGLDAARVDDLTLAVGELATNSLRHGGGRAHLRIWTEPGRLVCELADAGRIGDPLVGRTSPGGDPAESRGLWIVHQVCDLVQIRSGERGTVVRIHIALSA